MELQGVQQFIVPASSLGTNSPHVISIPISLLTQGNSQQLSILTSNGQILQIPSFCKY